MEWGGGAVDPASQTFVVNYSSAVQIYRLIPRAEYEGAASRGAETGGFFPMTGAPYGIQLDHLPQPARDALLEPALRLDHRL